jgi:hypothetical protein
MKNSTQASTSSLRQTQGTAELSSTSLVREEHGEKITNALCPMSQAAGGATSSTHDEMEFPGAFDKLSNLIFDPQNLIIQHLWHKFRKWRRYVYSSMNHWGLNL